MLPSAILLIALGILCGPLFGQALGFERSSLIEIVPFLAPLTLAFIAFDAGAHMNIHEVMEQSRRAFVLSILGFLLTASVMGVFMHVVLSLRWAFSFLLSSSWGGVSTATVVAVSRHLAINGKTATTLTISSLIDDVIVLVSALTILNYMTIHGTGLDDISLALARNVSISIFIGVIFGIAWLNILYISGTGGYTYTFTLAAVLLLYSGTELLGGTGAIAVFLFGLILGNFRSISKSLKMKVDIERLSRLRNSVVKFHAELTFIVVTFFFTFIGLIYVFSGVVDLVIGLVISLLIHGTRYVAVKIGTWRSPLSRDLPVIGLIVGKGAAAATMSTLPLAYGLPNTAILTSIALNVILFTNIVSIILPFIASRLQRKRNYV